MTEIALGGSLMLIWTLVNSMQLIIHSALLKVDMPANAMAFNTQLAYVFNLEILNVDGLFESVFDFTTLYQDDDENEEDDKEDKDEKNDSSRRLSQENSDREELEPEHRFE